jgi:hypothetical protein
MLEMFNRNSILLASLLLIACSGSKNENIAETKDSLTPALLPDVSLNSIPSKDSTVPSSITVAQLPTKCIYKGDFQEAWTWMDRSGENYLILSTLAQSRKDLEVGEDVNTKELFARQYILKEQNAEVVWDLYDLEKDCIFDLTAEFLFAPVFTDLDNDQIKENWLVYKLACRSDVSPARMKIVMHESKTKYALRGLMYVPMNAAEEPINIEEWEPDYSKIPKDESSTNWGRYEHAKEFDGAPEAFLEQARNLWRENFIER